MGVFWDQSTEDYIDWVGCVGVFGGGGQSTEAINYIYLLLVKPQKETTYNFLVKLPKKLCWKCCAAAGSERPKN